MSTSEEWDIVRGTSSTATSHTPESDAVLADLMEGNQRFAGGTSTQRHPHQDAARRDDLVGGQHPRAVVLGCSDSRAATEIVFDQGLGDLFTVRTAGEILDTAVLASLDFAVEGLGVPLLFVLGHENCGTIAATKQTLTGTPEGNVSVGGSQSAILEQVGLSIRTALNNGANTADTAAFERTHALRIASEILTRSRVIRTAVAQNRLGIAVGRYMITTGAVELLN